MQFVSNLGISFEMGLFDRDRTEFNLMLYFCCKWRFLIKMSVMVLVTTVFCLVLKTIITEEEESIGMQ